MVVEKRSASNVIWWNIFHSTNFTNGLGFNLSGIGIMDSAFAFCVGGSGFDSSRRQKQWLSSSRIFLSETEPEIIIFVIYPLFVGINHIY